MEQFVAEQRGTEPNLNAHVTDEQLELYALHRLPESEIGPLEEHLLICEVCREKLDKTADFAAGVRDAGTEEGSVPEKAAGGVPV